MTGGAGRGPRGGTAGIGMELCSLSVACSNGALSAVYGNSCRTFTDTCELGCRTSQMLFPYNGDDAVLARQYAREICEPEGGIGGQGGSDGGQGGSDGTGSAGEDGVGAQAGDGSVSVAVASSGNPEG